MGRGARWLLVVVGLVWGLPVLACGGSAVATATAIKTPVATYTPTPAGQAAAVVVEATATPVPATATPVPLSLRDRLLAAIGAESNRDVADRLQVDVVADVLSVRWAINDNLSSAWILAGAWRDVARMLAAVQESGETYGLIRFEGTFEMIDNFGNRSESVVLSASVSKETMGRINWDDRQWVDTILYQRLPEIADAVRVHPAFNE